MKTRIEIKISVLTTMDEGKRQHQMECLFLRNPLVLSPKLVQPKENFSREATFSKSGR